MQNSRNSTSSTSSTSTRPVMRPRARAARRRSSAASSAPGAARGALQRRAARPRARRGGARASPAPRLPRPAPRPARSAPSSSASMPAPVRTETAKAGAPASCPAARAARQIDLVDHDQVARPHQRRRPPGPAATWRRTAPAADRRLRPARGARRTPFGLDARRPRAARPCRPAPPGSRPDRAAPRSRRASCRPRSPRSPPRAGPARSAGSTCRHWARPGWRSRPRRAAARPPAVRKMLRQSHRSTARSWGSAGRPARPAGPRRRSRSPPRPRRRARRMPCAPALHLRPSAPSSWRSAWRRCASVSAATRSASPSTSARSSLPLSKARRVNSPGSASRRPEAPQRRQQRRHRRPAAMDVQLGHVLAGEAGRRREPQRQPVIQRSPRRGIATARRALPSWVGCRRPGQASPAPRPDARAREADHRDAGPARRRRRGEDGVAAHGTTLRHSFALRYGGLRPPLRANGWVMWRGKAARCRARRAIAGLLLALLAARPAELRPHHALQLLHALHPGRQPGLDEGLGVHGARPSRRSAPAARPPAPRSPLSGRAGRGTGAPRPASNRCRWKSSWRAPTAETEIYSAPRLTARRRGPTFWP